MLFPYPQSFKTHRATYGWTRKWPRTLWKPPENMEWFMADPHVVSFFPSEMCLLSNNIRDYHFVSQGKTTIPGLDDGEELLVTDVSACFSTVGSTLVYKPSVSSIRAHQSWPNSANRPLRATCFSVFVICLNYVAATLSTSPLFSILLFRCIFLSKFLFFYVYISFFLSLYFFCFSLHTISRRCRYKH